MRLLNAQSLKLQTFHGHEIPAYAILSHTWLPDGDEVTYDLLQHRSSKWHKRRGAMKIDFLCQQAKKDGLEWVWIDTCCIDKTNSVELSEAINSMFSWYKRSRICYVYLMDANEELGLKLGQSRWWSRAWTLQELIAPSEVNFYDFKWRFLGTKVSLSTAISRISGVDCESLLNANTIHVKSVACRFSWAAHREATRTEDLAYSLLGIFGVSLNMQYGEGTAAFKRLQKEILSSTNDQSLFAWGFAPCTLQELTKNHQGPGKAGLEDTSVDDGSDADRSKNANREIAWHPFGIFADSPSRFAQCGDIVFHHYHTFHSHVAEMNGALRMELLIAPLPDDLVQVLGVKKNPKPFPIALLPCGLSDSPNTAIGLLLEQWISGRYRRLEPVGGVFTFLVDCHDIKRPKQEFVWIDDAMWISRYQHGTTTELYSFHKSIRVELELPLEDYTLSVATRGWTFDEANRTLHRHHNVKNRKRHLEIALHRLRTSDYQVIVLQLSNRGDLDSAESDPSGNKVNIFKKSSLEEGPWLENGYDGRLYGSDVGRQACIEGIFVTLETHQVFNHLISTLKIGTTPPEQSATESAVTPISPYWPTTPAQISWPKFLP